MSRRLAALISLGCLVVLAAGLVIATIAGGGEAARWSAPLAAPIPPASVGTAQAIVDPAGRAHAAWVERRDGRWSLHESSRPLGGTWADPATVGPPSDFALVVAGLAANARGDAAVLFAYRGEHHRQVLAASTHSAGGTWSSPQALSRPTTAAVTSGGIGMDAAGTVTVIGRGLDGPGLWTSRRPAAGAWTAPARISPAGAGIDAPRLEVGADARVSVVALLKRAGRPPALWYRQADRTGHWGEDAILPGSDYARLPGIATGADGTSVVSWTRQTDSASTSHVLAALRSAGGAWSAPIDLDGPSDVGLASPLVDNAGGSVVWSRWDARPQQRRASILAQRLSAAGPAGEHSRVVGLKLAPVPTLPDTTVLYGPPPIQLVTASGERPVVAWGANTATSGGATAVAASQRSRDGHWGAEMTLSTPGRFALPLAAGSAADHAVVVWGEGPPAAATTTLLVSDR